MTETEKADVLRKLTMLTDALCGLGWSYLMLNPVSIEDGFVIGTHAYIGMVADHLPPEWLADSVVMTPPDTQ